MQVAQSFSEVLPILNESAADPFTQELYQAIHSGQLVLRYQQRINAEKVFLWEALPHWQHPTRGLLPPEDFAALAEESGTVYDIGLWMLGQVCADLAKWRKAALPFMQVCVPVPAVLAAAPGFVETFMVALTQYRISPRCLLLEVLPGHACDQAIARLRAMGVAVQWRAEPVAAEQVQMLLGKKPVRRRLARTR